MLLRSTPAPPQWHHKNMILTFFRTSTSCWVREADIGSSREAPLTSYIGNDPELDPERATPQPPVKTVDKPAARTGKRNAPAEAPVRGDAPATGRQNNAKASANANDNCTSYDNLTFVRPTSCNGVVGCCILSMVQADLCRLPGSQCRCG